MSDSKLPSKALTSHGRPIPPGGSRKGKPNKATKELKDMILGALSDAGGQDYLMRQANENPSAFLSLIAKVLPKEATHTIEGGESAIKVFTEITYTPVKSNNGGSS